jgi:hypothetical protein
MGHSNGLTLLVVNILLSVRSLTYHEIFCVLNSRVIAKPGHLLATTRLSCLLIIQLFHLSSLLAIQVTQEFRSFEVLDAFYPHLE